MIRGGLLNACLVLSRDASAWGPGCHFFAWAQRGSTLVLFSAVLAYGRAAEQRQRHRSAIDGEQARVYVNETELRGAGGRKAWSLSTGLPVVPASVEPGGWCSTNPPPAAVKIRGGLELPFRVASPRRCSVQRLVCSAPRLSRCRLLLARSSGFAHRCQPGQAAAPSQPHVVELS